MKRIVAILNDTVANTENIIMLLNAVKQYGFAEKVYFYTSTDIDTSKVPADAKIVVFSGDDDNPAKRRNAIIKTVMNENSDGFLHLIHDSMRFKCDPTEYFTKLEHTMTILDYASWFSTVTDKCNYVMTKYNPRMRILMDKPEFSKLDLPNICFTSHANTEYSVFKLDGAKIDDFMLDGRFSIPMFHIIEFFARRRNNNPGSLYFMNQYLTIDGESQVLDTVPGDSSRKPDDEEQKKMPVEDQLFKSMNINYQPDNNLDMILEQLYLKIRSKI